MIKPQKLLIGCLYGMSALMTACSSNNDATSSLGKGNISFNVTTETDFQTKALNEADYRNLHNYTVELRQGSDLKSSWKYDELPESIEIEAGTYQVKAYYGEDLAASRNSMYVEGTGNVTVNADQEEAQTVTVTCKPVCAKVTVKFSDEMDTYFSDYSVVFKTTALSSSTFVWNKNETDPVYLKVSQNESVSVDIRTTLKSNEKQSTVSKTYTMSPQTGLTINIAPVVTGDGDDSEGSLGIEIEIDRGTNDIEQDIEVPTDWI